MTCLFARAVAEIDHGFADLAGQRVRSSGDSGVIIGTGAVAG